MTKKILTAVIFCLFVVVTFLGRHIFASAQPGDVSDPVVTKSYVDGQINQLRALISSAGPAETYSAGASSLDPADIQSVRADALAYVDSHYGDMMRRLEADANNSAPYEVVSLEAGRTIIALSGTEIILRSGAAAAVTGVNGLCDVTAGKDILDGGEIPQNHLLIVPSSDGRGLRVTADAYLMIKGGYKLQF
jgi:hypothetical protein